MNQIQLAHMNAQLSSCWFGCGYRVEGPQQLEPYSSGNTSWLVVFYHPSEKYARRNGFIFPNFRGEHKKYLSCHHLASYLESNYFEPCPCDGCFATILFGIHRFFLKNPHKHASYIYMRMKMMTIANDKNHRMMS